MTERRHRPPRWCPIAPIAARKWVGARGGGSLLAAAAAAGAGSWARARSARCSSRRRSTSPQRIVELAGSGKLSPISLATLRVSALGFVIACVAGVLLPFLLRPSPRVTAAVEPFIMASRAFRNTRWRRG